MGEDGLFGQLEDMEEARQGKTRPPPKAPPAEQMQVHWHTHHPFQELVSSVRSWKSEELATIPTRSG